MTRFRSVKYRLYPSRIQERTMESYLEHCRAVYNKEVEMCRRAYEADGRILSQKSIQEYCEYVLVLDDQGLEEVFPDCLREVSGRVYSAFKRFESLTKDRKSKPILPAFKKPERYRSFTYPKFKGNVRLNANGKIWLHGILTLGAKKPYEPLIHVIM